MERRAGQTSDRGLCPHDHRKPAAPKFVPPEERIATFDQDGTLWVEHPVYSQLMYCLDRVPALAEEKPELKNVEPFKTVLSGDREASRNFDARTLEKIARRHAHRHDDGAVPGRSEEVAGDSQGPALETPLHRTHLPADAGGTEVSSRQRLQDLHRHRRRPGLRARLFRADLRHPARAGGRQRGCGTKYGYDKDGKPILTKEPKLLLNDNNAGKPEGIHLMIGRRPYAAFGNSTGDQQMLEYTKAGDGARLAMLVLHDDADARIRLRPRARAARHQGGHLHAGALRRGEEGWLVRHQHEERLESHLSL